MFARIIVTAALVTSLSGCAVTDTAKDVFGSISNKISGIFSSSGSKDEGKAQSLPTERILLRGIRGDLPITVETADSLEEREIGLMYRDILKLGTGMLFVFDDELPRNFWMKDTRMPLDIIYYSSKKVVVSVVEGMMPCNEETTNQLCPLYPSGAAAMYALEVPAGFAQVNEIRIGDALVRGE